MVLDVKSCLKTSKVDAITSTWKAGFEVDVVDVEVADMANVQLEPMEINVKDVVCLAWWWPCRPSLQAWVSVVLLSHENLCGRLLPGAFQDAEELRRKITPIDGRSFTQQLHGLPFGKLFAGRSSRRPANFRGAASGVVERC